MRRTAWLTLLALVLCLLTGTAFGDDANLLKNGSFDLIGSDGLPENWYVDAYNNREGVTVYSVTEEAHGGSHAAVVENLGLNDARFAQRVWVEPGCQYRLSGWIRADRIADSGRGANLSVEGVYVFSESVFDSEGEWVYVETYGLTGADQEAVTVYARVGGYSGESIGLAAFDDLRLEKVEQLPEDAAVYAWYQKSAPQAAAPSVDETDEEQIAKPFWPWLLAISAAFAFVSLQQGSYMQLDKRDEATAALARGRSRMPAFAVAGMVIAAVLRLVIAHTVYGYDVDVNCFTAWGNTMAQVGPTMFYQSNWCDYTPGYVYVMGLNGHLSSLLLGIVSPAFVHKLVPMACDMAAAWLIYRLAVENRFTPVQAGRLALIAAFNPAIFLNSAAWCQIDSVLCFLLMLVAWFALKRKWALVLPTYVLCILVKPQALMLGFLGLAAIVMELVKHPVTIRKNAMNTQTGKHVKLLPAWFSRLAFPEEWKAMGVGLLLSGVVAALIIVPFSIHQESGDWLIKLYGDTLASYPYATVNTANLYYLLGANWQSIVFDATTPAIIFFLLLSAGWAAYTFIRRQERDFSWIDTAIIALVVLALVAGVLGVMPLLGGEESFAERLAQPYMLTTHNPWVVQHDRVSSQYQRIYAPEAAADAWILEIPAYVMLIAAVVLAAVALGLGMMKSRRGMSRIRLTMAEPVLMALFAVNFARMLVFDTTWLELGIAAMAMAFAVVLPVFIRSGKLEHLPLCGGVLFVLLYVLGIKMHERYLFPALFLLGMGYAIRRDKRILWLLTGLTCTLFINEGIILDNSLRLGREMGHLNSDTVVLAQILSTANVFMALASMLVCHSICIDPGEVRLSDNPGQYAMPARKYDSDPHNLDNYSVNPTLKIGRIDVLLMAVVTAVYAIVTLTTLGSTKAPQRPWKSTNHQERVIIDLGQHYDDFSMLYFCQVSYDDFTVATSDDGETWSEENWAEMAQGQCFRWKYLVPSYEHEGSVNYIGANTFEDVKKLSGRFVRIDPRQIGLIINEVIFRDSNGERIDAMVVGAENPSTNSPLYSDPECLLDEQDTLEGEPGWWNSTYFDEIYHARTAFEHLNGSVPYETSHPPLGKVIMSWCVSIFGMTPFGWRFAGALCGILMLPVMYLLAKQLTKRTDLAFAAMMLMTLDCMHFTQTRIATIDSFPVLFIMLSYFFMLRFMQKDIVLEKMHRLLPDLALSGFFMGCGIASKWIGVYAGAGLAVLYFWTCFRHLNIGVLAARVLRRNTPQTQEKLTELDARDQKAFRRVFFLCLWCLLFFVLIPLAIYLLSYIPYFAYKRFNGIFDYMETVYLANFGKTNSMLSYHSTPRLGMDHPYYSPWYEWPLMQTPMYYASPAFTPEGWSYAIYCFGNPAVWFVGLAGIIYVAYRWVKQHRYLLDGREGSLRLYADTWDMSIAFILIGILAQYLPWVLVPRGTYIYHYFASVPFLILATVMLLERIGRNHPVRGRVVMIVYLVICLIMFVVLFPYASGVLTPDGWMSFVADYPWLQELMYKHDSALLDWLSEVMHAIPWMPDVYH